MSNVPHRYTTPQEDITTGKIMIIFFATVFGLLLVSSLICLFDQSTGWAVSLVLFIFSFVCIPGILAGKQAIETGKLRALQSQRDCQVNRMTCNNPTSSSGSIPPTQTRQRNDSIGQTIDALLSNNPIGIKASRIAEITGISKSTVNRYLYSHQNAYRIDSSYRWTKR